MAKREKVIFDTSVISGEEGSGSFLGGRTELEKFAAVADIVLPEIVVEEVRAQKYRSLISKRDSFLGNAFHKIFGLDEKHTSGFNIRDHIAELEASEPIDYKIIALADYSVIRIMKDMALIGQAPFAAGSDKGFKDAYIHFTIMEYQRTLDGEKVFLVTNDGRLKESFDSVPGVVVVKGFDEFSKYRVEPFQEEYFVQKLQADVDESIAAENVFDVFLNTNENWVLQIETAGKAYRVEIDLTSREIVGFTETDIPAGVAGFKTRTGSFAGTHAAVADLAGEVNYLTDTEICTILREATINEQIYWIASDDDVKAFLLPLFEAKGKLLTTEEQTDFRAKFYD